MIRAAIGAANVAAHTEGRNVRSARRPRRSATLLCRAD